MLKIIQKGDPAARGVVADDTWPPAAMAHRLTKVCDECGSGYYVSASHMATLCPECAHHLYGYPACDHMMAAGRCETCGWDGSVSDLVASLRETSRK